MARHMITENELSDWLALPSWDQAAASHGDGSRKTLEVSNKNEFRVTDHGTRIYEGKDLAAAVAAYNEAP